MRETLWTGLKIVAAICVVLTIRDYIRGRYGPRRFSPAILAAAFVSIAALAIWRAI